MKYMLDTNTCIYLINHRSQKVIQKFLSYDPNDICISTITYAELLSGLEKNKNFERNQIAMTLFLSPITILTFDDKVAETYGKVRASFDEKNTSLNQLDMLIASHAISENLTLVTNNEKGFKKIKGLKVENWI